MLHLPELNDLTGNWHSVKKIHHSDESMVDTCYGSHIAPEHHNPSAINGEKPVRIRDVHIDKSRVYT